MAGPYLLLRGELGPPSGKHGSNPWSALELICFRKRARGWPRIPSSLAEIYGPVWAGPLVVFQPSYLHATGEVGPRDGIWFGTECLLP